MKSQSSLLTESQQQLFDYGMRLIEMHSSLAGQYTMAGFNDQAKIHMDISADGLNQLNDLMKRAVEGWRSEHG